MLSSLAYWWQLYRRLCCQPHLESRLRKPHSKGISMWTSVEPLTVCSTSGWYHLVLITVSKDCGFRSYVTVHSSTFKTFPTHHFFFRTKHCVLYHKHGNAIVVPCTCHLLWRLPEGYLIGENIRNILSSKFLDLITGHMIIVNGLRELVNLHYI